MSIEYTCADCGAVTEVADELAGHRARCRKCNAPGPVSVPRRLHAGGPRGMTDVVRGVLWALCAGWVALAALAYLNGSGAAAVACWVLIGWAGCFAADAALRALSGTRGGP
jgi:hypothetical protein